jgi:DNA-binding winged helix-turn-helix (wHTH) protein/Tol biopolymer transport system component
VRSLDMTRRYRFGSFELDAQGPRLIASGKTVKIQPQPLRVLIVLVQRAGELVTRDELRAAIWGEATFVEFDQGLNYCIRQIRVALGDNAAEPAFLETAKGQGYRFVAAVTTDAAAEPAAGAARAAWVAAAAAVILVAVIASAWFYMRRPRSGAASVVTKMEPLTDFADAALAPVLSPDGTLVAFIRGSSGFLTPDDIYVKALPNGEARRLVHDPRLKYGPAFSPDGSLLAYTVMEGPGWSTYAVPVNGGEPRRLLTNAAGLTWLDEGRLLFAEVRGGQHMGVVTGPETRSGVHDVYFPAHERAMAHYAVASPDRRWALIVEMDDSGRWAPCRLAAMDGSEHREVGPPQPCFAAAWSPDGRWMYFNNATDGRAHLWRQRGDSSSPEQLTGGPADELGIAMAPDGRSIVTSVGGGERTLWLHTAAGDRPLTFEGEITGSSALSADGGRLYYALSRAANGGRRELHRRTLATDQDDVLLPGVAIKEFDISPDGSRIVYSTPTASGSTQLWIAALDGRTPPRAFGATGEQSPRFGPGGEVIARVSDGRKNYLRRWHEETGWTNVVPQPINEIQSVSPSRRWAMVIAPLSDNSTVAPMAVPLAGGDPVRVCEIYCEMSWASDGSALYVSVEEASLSSPGRALRIPAGPGESLPPLPVDGLRPGAAPSDVAGASSMPRAELIAGPDRATFAYVRTTGHRNLFRIVLPES